MSKKSKNMWSQIGTHAFLLVISVTVLFPILWIISLALDPEKHR